MKVSFGEKVRRRRKYRQITLRELAAAIAFDQSSLSKVERGEMVAPSRLIKPLAVALDSDYKDFQVSYLTDKLMQELSEEDYVLEALQQAMEVIKSERVQKRAVKRERMLAKVRAYFETIPVEKAWLFGSFSRQAEGSESDLDLLVRFVQPNKIDLFDYVGYRQDLEDLTGRNVDLVEEGYLTPEAEPNVVREKQLIYARKAKR